MQIDLLVPCHRLWDLLRNFFHVRHNHDPIFSCCFLSNSPPGSSRKPFALSLATGAYLLRAGTALSSPYSPTTPSHRHLPSFLLGNLSTPFSNLHTPVSSFFFYLMACCTPASTVSQPLSQPSLLTPIRSWTRVNSGCVSLPWVWERHWAAFWTE